MESEEAEKFEEEEADRQGQQRWWRLDTTISKVRINVRAAVSSARVTPAKTVQVIPPLTLGEVKVNEHVFSSSARFLLWINQLVVRSVASSGIDAFVGVFTAAGHTAESVVDSVLGGVDHVVDRAIGPQAPLSLGLQGLTGGTRHAAGGLVQGTVGVVSGVGEGGKSIVSAASSGTPQGCANGLRDAAGNVCGGAFAGVSLVLLGFGKCFGTCTTGCARCVTCQRGKPAPEGWGRGLPAPPSSKLPTLESMKQARLSQEDLMSAVARLEAK